MTKLSVNINKFATLRNARGGNLPDILKVAKDCESFGQTVSPFTHGQMNAISVTRTCAISNRLSPPNSISKAILLPTSWISCWT